MVTTCAGDTSILDTLLDHGGDTSAVDKQGYNLLHCACQARDTQIIQFLLNNVYSRSESRDSILHGLSEDGCSPFDVAMRSDKKKWQMMSVAEELVCAGAHVDLDGMYVKT